MDVLSADTLRQVALLPIQVQILDGGAGADGFEVRKGKL